MMVAVDLNVWYTILKNIRFGFKKLSGLFSTRKPKFYMNEVSFTDEMTLGVVNSLWKYSQTLAEL